MSNSSAIVYLLNNAQKDISNFRQSIQLLYSNYYIFFPCDIICFYEDNFPEQELQYLKIVLSNMNVSFCKIQFDMPEYSVEQLKLIPEYFPHPDFPQAQGFSIGYRHMCRFFAGSIFKHPIIKQYKYLWRLDTDSFIQSPITYNVFNKLKQNNSFYGYINIQNDHPGAVLNLWETSQQYFSSIHKDHIFRYPSIEFHKNKVFYTNFEVLDVDWFISDDYQSFFYFIDNTAGIYKYRWGDHSIRYIALNSLLSPEQLYFYDDIDYYHHDRYYNTRIKNNSYAN